MDDEIAKLALECLKTELETKKLYAETDKMKAMAYSELTAALKPLISGFSVIVAQFLAEWLKKTTMPNPNAPSDISLTKEDLTFFAKKCSIEDLEKLIKDLADILKTRTS